MSVKRSIIEVGFDKDHQFDFGISGDILDLSVEQMNKLRAMIVCAIGTAEDMFRREIERRDPPAMEGRGAGATSAAKDGRCEVEGK
jgi:hypothetical protein